MRFTAGAVLLFLAPVLFAPPAIPLRACVSITNDETRQVTTITPKR